MAGLGLLGSAGWPGLDAEPAALEGAFALLAFCSWEVKGTPKPASRAFVLPGRRWLQWVGWTLV